MQHFKEIPKFKNEEEEADFWATHDTADYVDLSNLVEASFPNLKRSEGLIPLVLDKESATELRELAEQLSVDLPELAAQYVREGIKRDAHYAAR